MAPVKKLKSWGQEIWQRWKEDDASTLAASVAFYAIFSLAPLLVLAVAIAALVFGEQAAQGELTSQLEEFVGSAGAEAFQTILANAAQPGGGGIIATIISLAILIYGASKVFAQLQKSLNRIWDVRSDPDAGIKGLAWRHITGFAMVFGIGVLLIALIALSTFLSNLQGFVGDVPGGATIWMTLNFVVQAGIITVLFAAIFRYIPQVQIEWSDVWLGAAFTAVLFLIGQFLLGIYLSQASPGSAYGAAGSLVALLAWLFFSVQILFVGAEFTQVYARRRDRQIRPDKNAVPERLAYSSGEQPA